MAAVTTARIAARGRLLAHLAHCCGRSKISKQALHNGLGLD